MQRTDAYLVVLILYSYFTTTMLGSIRGLYYFSDCKNNTFECVSQANDISDISTIETLVSLLSDCDHFFSSTSKLRESSWRKTQ